jgi:periplasmic protein TonB
MFAESLLESGAPVRTRRAWTTLLSVGVQGTLLAVLIALPLISPEALRLTARVPLFAPSVTADPAPTPRAQRLPSKSASAVEVISVPSPTTPKLEFGERRQEPAPGPVDLTGIHTRNVGPALPFSSETSSMRLPELRPATPSRVVVSELSSGSLIHRVQPNYPAIAKTAGIQGEVVLQAVISRDGQIESLRPISGHPLLLRAAMDAVRQWRYRPYVLNGQTIEVETQISVIFRMLR